MEQLTDGFQANAFDFLKQFLSLASNGKSAIGTDKGNLVIGYSKSTKKLFLQKEHIGKKIVDFRFYSIACCQGWIP